MTSKFRSRKLKNGMTVFHEFRDLPLVSVAVSNRFGASFEPAKLKGIAHFIEHLVFTGTKNRSFEQISREIEEKGGVLNAFTSHDVTSFWFKMPSEHLMTGLDVLSDILNNPTFPLEKFEKEKSAVLEEIKMYHDHPSRHVHDLLESNLFGAPFGLGIAGSAKSVSSISRDFVLDFFKKHYSANNLFVTVVGNADFEGLCDFFEANFVSKSEVPKSLPIVLKNDVFVEERSGIDQAQFAFGVHAPPMNSSDWFVLEVLEGYLTNGGSSKLFVEIREKRGLAYSVSGSVNSEGSYSYYSIVTGTTKGAIPKVLELILEGFGSVQDLSESDLSSIKEKLVGLRKVSSEESVGVLTALIFSQVGAGSSEKYYDYEAGVRAVTLSDLKSLAKVLVKNFSTAAIVPK